MYQVDAFTGELFRGNPAAVCPLEEWLPDPLMQSIAAENNLSETAFFVPKGEDWELRWFTPVSEIPLCGHATLASAFILFFELGKVAGDVVTFHSPHSGVLPVRRQGDVLVLDFPALASTPCATGDATVHAVGAALGWSGPGDERLPSRHGFWTRCRSGRGDLSGLDCPAQNSAVTTLHVVGVVGAGENPCRMLSDRTYGSSGCS